MSELRVLDVWRLQVNPIVPLALKDLLEKAKQEIQSLEERVSRP